MTLCDLCVILRVLCGKKIQKPQRSTEKIQHKELKERFDFEHSSYMRIVMKFF